MNPITCIINGQEFHLEYEKTSITSGILYHGTVFEKHIFEFFFVIFKNGDPDLFSPLDTIDSKKRSIIEAIKKADEKAAQGHTGKVR
ncbi:MAG: hypothetical protein ACHQET_11515 [Chitinophagales bacterium]